MLEPYVQNRNKGNSSSFDYAGKDRGNAPGARFLNVMERYTECFSPRNIKNSTSQRQAAIYRHSQNRGVYCPGNPKSKWAP